MTLFGPDIPRRTSADDPSMLYRATDPATSRIAAEKVTRTTAQSNRAILLAAVEQHPGRTAVELAALTGVDRHMASRRLADLRNAGKVYNGPERACSVAGSVMMTWWTVRPAAGTRAGEGAI
jgi:predicted transcriptional regulator